MTPIDEVLAKIRERAATLNEKTDALNVSIENLEAQLEGVGVEFWWTTTQIPDPNSVDRGFAYIDEDSRHYVLGYCKIGDKWRIATKKRATGMLQDTRDVGDPMPLVKAPRTVRLEVSRHLEEFFKALLQQIDSVHAKLDQALSAAKPLLSPKNENPKSSGTNLNRRKPGR